MSFFSGLGTAFALIALAAFFIIVSGAYNVAAIEPDTEVERLILHSAMRYSIQARARHERPEAWSEAQVTEGFRHYDAMCIICHGAPGKRRSAIGQGLRPQPPNLVEASERWTSAQLFWIIKNGIKMTGMPAFGLTHQDEQIWSIVGFVRRLPRISAQEFELMEKQHGSRSEHEQAPNHQ